MSSRSSSNAIVSVSTNQNSLSSLLTSICPLRKSQTRVRLWGVRSPLTSLTSVSPGLSKDYPTRFRRLRDKPPSSRTWRRKLQRKCFVAIDFFPVGLFLSTSSTDNKWIRQGQDHAGLQRQRRQAWQRLMPKLRRLHIKNEKKVRNYLRNKALRWNFSLSKR